MWDVFTPFTTSGVEELLYTSPEAVAEEVRRVSSQWVLVRRWKGREEERERERNRQRQGERREDVYTKKQYKDFNTVYNKVWPYFTFL